MEKLTQQALQQILDFIKSAGNFVAEQAPIYVQELLKYEAWNSHLWMILFLIPTGLFLGLTIILFCSEEEFLVGFTAPIILLITIALGIGAGVNYSDLKKIELAPRVFVLEYLQNRVRSQ